uniref:Uncharacterized protein n=1 Tax=Cacopsylla melanoneura TaxID=428564 RepID=A0A8D8S2I6_9HEMI
MARLFLATLLVVSRVYSLLADEIQDGNKEAPQPEKDTLAEDSGQFKNGAELLHTKVWAGLHRKKRNVDGTINDEEPGLDKKVNGELRFKEFNPLQEDKEAPQQEKGILAEDSGQFENGAELLHT